MKTKVIISAAAFFAVAFIGLARPQAAAVARENAPAETATPAVEATPSAPAAPAQAVQQTPEKQKKEEAPPGEPQEKEKKTKKEVTIVVGEKETRKGPVELTIIDGQTKKEIKLDGSVLVLKKGEDGKTILVNPEGKEIAVISGEGTRLEIHGGRMIFLNDEDALPEPKEPRVFTIIEGDTTTSTVLDGDKKSYTVVVKTKPHLEIVKEVEEPEHITIKQLDTDGNVYISKRRVASEPSVGMAGDEGELEKKLAETQALLKKMDELKLAESSLKTQQEALRELEQSLKALEEELKKKEESLKAHEIHAEKDVYVSIDRERMPEVLTWVEKTQPDDPEKHNTIWISKDKEAYSVVMTMKLKDNPKATYEKAVAKLEKELPQGYRLEPKFVEESGMMVLKISAPGGSEEDLQKVQRLVEELQSELKK